jgi:hypothetical protein
LLSKIKAINIFILIAVFISFVSCEKHENKNVAKPANPQTNTRPEISIDQVKKILGNNVIFIERGRFATDSSREIIAGKEFNSAKEFGIKFFLLDDYDDTLKVVYQTDLLAGSFKDCLVNKFKINNLGYNLIYYNSRDYFMGSGGGEIYSYLIDFSKHQVYLAHFFTVPDKPVSLYISPNTEDPEIRNFLINKYKRDYPDLKIVNKDYKLEDIL